MKSRRRVIDGTVGVYFKKCFGAGVSLGDYIILDTFYIGKTVENIILHEHGHQLQSKKLGWLYPPLVGLPSICRNVWDRLIHKKWTKERRTKWYYSGYPERWADKLGGVVRD